MVSKPLAERLGHLRSRFGVEVEILDASLAAVYPQRVAAVLTHTDANGSDQVVDRLRRRLADKLRRMNLSRVSVGHAAFCAECRTAEALQSQAMRDAEPVAA